MELKGKKIGVALTGSFCTYKKVFQELEKLAEEGAQIQTIFSDLPRVLTAVSERQKIL